VRRFNDRKIYEDADCVEIAESIGIKMQKRGSSMFIECPEHEKNAGKRDTDLDRCIVSPKGYHCFSCGANGGVISMVRNFLGTSPYETRKTIATLLGSVNNYLEDGEYDPSKEQPYKKEQLEALGLCQTVVAYLPAALCESEDEVKSKNLSLGKDNVFLSFDEEGNPHFDTEKTNCITQDETFIGYQKDVVTLNSLFQEEPDVFYDLIMRKSVEMYWKWKKLADCSDVIEKIIPSQELAYHAVTKFKRNMGICERIYQSLAVKKPA